MFSAMTTESIDGSGESDTTTRLSKLEFCSLELRNKLQLPDNRNLFQGHCALNPSRA